MMYLILFLCLFALCYGQITAELSNEITGVHKAFMMTFIGTLTSSLGFAGGVMLYVSLVELVPKSIVAFGFIDKKFAGLYACLVFLIGMLVTSLIDTFAEYIEKSDKDKQVDGNEKNEESFEKREETETSDEEENEKEEDNSDDHEGDDERGEVNELKQKADTGRTLRTRRSLRIAEKEQKPDHTLPVTGARKAGKSTSSKSEETKKDRKKVVKQKEREDVDATTGPKKDDDATKDREEWDRKEDELNKKLFRLGWKTAIALALHNIPEGMAAFVSSLADIKLGFLVTLAIVFHNIPEGLSVALPVYYATGSRWKAFLYSGVLAGMAEPLGGLIAFYFLGNHMPPLFEGMMVFVSIQGLLPTARKLDKEDKYVSKAVLIGMIVMSVGIGLINVSN
ncbi:Zinc/iron permease domain-containing protein [Rozella allomycis CSF55]|uniref:Zinc/iron permease domain-containing protein n=1 Tax=Rozella allomycis (strain CSF55) TaxID=988480 RepID=A0A075B0I9_ROZAC|nr:Zinc/iron permease domain-containing protein [Rozella allomycis CSF55]|eukprot:EPZ34474.1 Zinc/iron permease domain-containing protein [Rozella allomycis CSF55]